MKLVKFHKFICRFDKSLNLKTDVYVNPLKIDWIEDCVDDNRHHACIYLGSDDFINVFEQLEDAVKALESYDKVIVENKVVKDEEDKCKDSKEVDAKEEPKEKKLKKRRVSSRTKNGKVVKELKESIEEVQRTSELSSN